MPLTASVESGQSSPSLSTGGGCDRRGGVGVGGGACWAGGTTGVFTSGAGGGASGPCEVFGLSSDGFLLRWTRRR